MKITGISATWLHVPIPPERQHASDYGLSSSFDTALVRVDTDAGITGWGEVRGALPAQCNCAGVCAVIENEFAPLLLGEDPRDISRLWEVMYNTDRAHFALARGHAFPNLGRRGVNVQALSGIDIALWDIKAKSLGVPVWQLLGGKRQAKMLCYASGGWAPADRIAEQLKAFLATGGYRAVKMRVGSGDGTLAHSVERVKRAREALGPDIDIMCDVHGTWTVSEAKRFCRQIADCNIGWLEEPVSPDDKVGMAEVRAYTDIAIAAGEGEFTRFDFRDLIVGRCVDIVQPDPMLMGGITETMRVDALASAFQVRTAPHLWGSAVGFAAGLHCAAAAVGGFILEYSAGGGNPLINELALERFPTVEGYLEIPDRPGLGVTVDESVVARYRKEWRHLSPANGG